jgi:hypothetical protein
MIRQGRKRLWRRGECNSGQCRVCPLPCNTHTRPSTRYTKSMSDMRGFCPGGTFLNELSLLIAHCSVAEPSPAYFKKQPETARCCLILSMRLLY